MWSSSVKFDVISQRKLHKVKVLITIVKNAHHRHIAEVLEGYMVISIGYVFLGTPEYKIIHIYGPDIIQVMLMIFMSSMWLDLNKLEE